MDKIKGNLKVLDTFEIAFFNVVTLFWISLNFSLICFVVQIIVVPAEIGFIVLIDIQ
jgi:hypothetical protein